MRMELLMLSRGKRVWNTIGLGVVTILALYATFHQLTGVWLINL